MDGLDRFDQRGVRDGHWARRPARRSTSRKEDPRLRDRYGRHQWGQSALLARRLVEAGVRFVTLTFGGWDFHSSLENGHEARAARSSTRPSARLVDDLDDRGLLDSTIVMVMGEFGRTPRMNTTGVPGADPVPGRDHWGKVMSVLVAGGGFAARPGRRLVERQGRGPQGRPSRPQDLLVTLYRQLGIDPETSFTNRAGRPITIGSTGRVIDELC